MPSDAELAEAAPVETLPVEPPPEEPKPNGKKACKRKDPPLENGERPRCTECGALLNSVNQGKRGNKRSKRCFVHQRDPQYWSAELKTYGV